MTTADVYRALWRHKFLIAALTVVAVATTWYLVSREAKTYEASTLVRIQERNVAPGDTWNALDTSQRLAQTYSEIINSEALRRTALAAAASAQGGRAPSPAVTISADPVQQTELIWISARSRRPAEAAAVANAVPTALRDFIRQTGRRNEQVIAVKPATAPTSAVAPRVKLDVGLALLVGLIFNTALALVIELVRDRMPQPEEIGASLGSPVLATIPILTQRGAGPVPRPSPRSARRPAPAHPDAAP